MNQPISTQEQLEKRLAETLAELNIKNRELEIESALERVRSRSMAMQKSEELKDVIQVVYDQFLYLKIPIEHTGFVVDYQFKGDWHFWIADRNGTPSKITVPYYDGVWNNDFNHAKQQGLQLFTTNLNFEEKNEFYQKLLAFIPGLSEDAKEFYFSCPGLGASTVLFENTALYIENFSGYNYSEEENSVLIRFGKVFEQAYARFMDLLKAEEQAVEARIEVSLERIRSRAMAMRNTEELLDAADLVGKELTALGIESMNVSYAFLDEGEMSASYYSVNPIDGKILPFPFVFPHTETDVMISILSSWKNHEALNILELDEEATLKHQSWVGNHIRSLFEQKGIPFSIEEFLEISPAKAVIYTFNFANGYLFKIGSDRLNELQKDILLRVTKVFDMTYRRFLDLQQAEAQARESQIQLAMERVRARTMAMQKSEELVEVASLLFDQVLSLGTKQWGSGFNIWHPENISATAFMANPDGSFGKPFEVPYTEDPFFKNIYAEKQRGADFYVTHSEGRELEQTYQYMFSLPDARKHFDNIQSLGFQVPAFQTTHCAFFQQGFLMFITFEPVPEMWEIFKRFAKVFEQTYTRFLDLQKSEAQAREARIEAALERVRSRTIGMQNSHELQDAAQIMFQQIQELGVHQWSCGYNIWDDDKKYCTAWMSAEGTIQAPFKTPSSENVFLHFYEASLIGEDLYVEEISGEACAEHYRFLSTIPVAGDVMKGWEAAGIAYPTHQIFHIAYFKQGYLMFITYEPVPEAHDIFRRFGKVFEQTYTRFLDLQKSEAQTRESQIQLAMERVRARTMAMQHSNELPDAANLLFQQVQSLGMPAWSAGYCLWADNKNAATFFMSSEGVLQSPITMPLTDDPTLRHMRDGSDSPTSFYVDEIEGEVCSTHYDYMRTLPGVRDVLQSIIDSGFPLPTHQINHMAYFPQGFLLFITYQPVPEAHDIFKRFARVFEQTYTRFLDLQRAEAQGLEAIKRASVDRVRAEIASMRTSTDLEKITPLIWNELLTLEVPFIRCGVFIMDEENEQVNTFLSTPDGKAIAAFHQPFDSPGDIKAIVGSWYKKQVYKQHWDERQFMEFTSGLVKQGVISAGEKYITENHPTDLYLHFLPFLQGMLYVGNTSALGEGDLQLVQNLADAFSTAYARYEDFNKLEAAKEQVDKTLSDLKQTQAQLVQAEKMASLGELTAGIAHEIQNPLNFVNNFSELSSELIAEMEEEMDKGNSTGAKQIAEDIRANLEKINLHGKRADAIVKGMLQHSRTSSGEKQPTDINALADEYLRLAYHGLRAKDKTFNASLETDFDQSIGKVNIIPQDIGRVLLNLISNAFYAVDEKMKSGIDKFEPRVSVNTKMVNGTVDITIVDNGNGIPGKVKDKIFQPFFTTKPTGQGTGLGLSLAYDIVKAHGGEIKVETKEWEGSKFTINIPFN